MGLVTEDNSLVVGASRTIFLDWRVLRARKGSEKGGLRMPIFGVIMNF